MAFVDWKIAESLSGAVKIPTVSGKDALPLAEFAQLRKYLEETFPLVHHTLSRTLVGEANLVYCWKGSGGTDRLPLGLLAHQDVVPADTPEEWTYPPFAGVVEHGVLWGRGSIDSKSHLILHMTVIERLIESGFKPKNDIYLCYGSNEELMLEKSGAGEIADYLRAAGVRLGCTLDEGGGLFPGNMFQISRDIAFVALAEKGYADFEIVATAEGGHPSLPAGETAIGKLCRAGLAIESSQPKARVLDAVRDMIRVLAPHLRTLFTEWMENQNDDQKLINAMEKVPAFGVLLRSTASLTMARAGVQSNMMPSTATLTVNCRLLPGDTVRGMEKYLRSLMPEGVEVHLLHGQDPSGVTPADSAEMEMLEGIIHRHYPEKILAPMVLPGGTDSRFYYLVCDNVFRFSPVDDCEHIFTVHKKDERLKLSALGKAAEFYEDFIRSYSEL